MDGVVVLWTQLVVKTVSDTKGVVSLFFGTKRQSKKIKLYDTKQIGNVVFPRATRGFADRETTDDHASR